MDIHTNKDVLDKAGETGGEPSYNGKVIYTELSRIDGGTFN